MNMTTIMTIVTAIMVSLSFTAQADLYVSAGAGKAYLNDDRNVTAVRVALGKRYSDNFSLEAFVLGGADLNPRSGSRVSLKHMGLLSSGVNAVGSIGLPLTPVTLFGSIGPGVMVDYDASGKRTLFAVNAEVGAILPVTQSTSIRVGLATSTGIDSIGSNAETSTMHSFNIGLSVSL